MLEGLRRRMAVAGTAVMVMIPLSAQPANAVAINWTQIITAGIQAVSSAWSAQNTQEAIRQATQQIIAAVNTARSDILAQIETITVNEYRACANHAVIEFADIERMTPDNAQRFAQDATGCAVTLMSVIPGVTGKAGVNELGFALNIVSPIAIIARLRTGLTADALRIALRSAENNLITRLTADGCTISSIRLDPELPLPRRGELVPYDILCTAFNRDVGTNGIEVPWPQQVPHSAVEVAQERAMGNTSRAIAVAVLPQLGS